MDEIGENAFISEMEKEVSNIFKVIDAQRDIQMKELIIKKQFLMQVDSL